MKKHKKRNVVILCSVLVVLGLVAYLALNGAFKANRQSKKHDRGQLGRALVLTGHKVFNPGYFAGLLSNKT